jgi:hypothetical protein
VEVEAAQDVLAEAVEVFAEVAHDEEEPGAAGEAAYRVTSEGRVQSTNHRHRKNNVLRTGALRVQLEELGAQMAVVCFVVAEDDSAVAVVLLGELEEQRLVDQCIDKGHSRPPHLHR